MILDGVARDQLGRGHEVHALVERHKAAGDGGGAGATSAWRTSQSMMIWRSPRSSSAVTARKERPISRWISWVRPLCLPAAALAPGAFGGRARQHAVFGGHPAAPGAAQEGRRLVLQARRAQHMGVAEFDQAGALSMFQHTGFQLTRRISS